MKLFLTKEKVSKIGKEPRHFLHQSQLTLREGMHLIGMMSATLPAVLAAPLHFRALQNLVNGAVTKNLPLQSQLLLDSGSKKDLQWWTTNLLSANGQPLRTPSPDIVMETDASLKRWGAVMGSQRAGGPWMDSEVGDHINLLELKAAGLALRSFVSNQKNKHILICMDNRVAIAYVNAKGGTRPKALNQEALETWESHYSSRACTWNVEYGGRL